jgi:hypothetical protein
LAAVATTKSEAAVIQFTLLGVVRGMMNLMAQANVFYVKRTANQEMTELSEQQGSQAVVLEMISSLSLIAEEWHMVMQEMMN